MGGGGGVGDGELVVVVGVLVLGELVVMVIFFVIFVKGKIEIL